MNVKLEEAWKGGMKYAGKRCKDEIEEVANSLAISTERVKVNTRILYIILSGSLL